jgi:cytochrome c oxidase subunit 2
MRNAVTRWPVRKTAILLSVALLSFVSASAALALDPTGQPPGITKEADDMHKLYLFVTAVAAVVFVGVEAALIFMILRFRKKNDELPPQIHGNNVIEVIWTAIPVIIVVSMFTAAFIVLTRVESSAAADDMTIDVTGFRFSWQFDYHLNDIGPGSDKNSDQVVTVLGKAGVENEPTLVIPSGEPIEFALKSNDVIHSFYVRDFLYKLDVIPGRDNRFVITAKPGDEGTYHAQCAELCGLDHALMRFNVKVVTREEFDQWIQQQAAAAAQAARAP